MAKSRKGEQGTAGQDRNGLNRRQFVTTGAAAGLGAVALLDTDAANAQRRSGDEIEWHHEVDVVVCGGGCAGITAAIRARDLGASVLIVDQNFDLGGRMLHSGGFVSLGGGDPLQVRDMRGESDKEGFVTAAPVEDPE
jgi:NADPH-dependent 2,4-dienoyl-CoA reductase/sulfur reductase-like enzyme